MLNLNKLPMKLRKRNVRKEEILNNHPISEEMFFQYQQKRSKLSEGIILKPNK